MSAYRIYFLCLAILFSWSVTLSSAKSLSPGDTASVSATVTDVKFTRGVPSETLTLVADRPFTYSYYRLNHPARLIIDLNMTTAGTYTEPLSFQGGLVKQVRLITHNRASGLLTRVECFLTRDVKFSVKRPNGDERSLNITMEESSQKPTYAVETETDGVDKRSAADSSKSAPAAKGTAGTAKSAVSAQSGTTLPKSTATPAEQAKHAEGAKAGKALPRSSDSAMVKPAAPDGGATTSAPTPAGTDPSNGAGRILVAIVATPEGINIMTDGPVKNYYTFAMSKPDRLVIDLPGVRNGMRADKVPISVFGITGARVGTHDGKIRIVITGAPEAIQKNMLVKTPTGLRLTLSDPNGAGAKAK